MFGRKKTQEPAAPREAQTPFEPALTEHSAPERRIASEADFTELYGLMLGEKVANGIADVQSAFRGRNYPEAAAGLKKLRGTYEQLHLKTLRRDPEHPDGPRSKSIPARAEEIRGKQHQIKTALAKCDQILAGLQYMIEFKLTAAAPDAPANEVPEIPAARLAALDQAPDAEARLNLLKESFLFKPVDAACDIQPGAQAARSRGGSSRAPPPNPLAQTPRAPASSHPGLPSGRRA